MYSAHNERKPVAAKRCIRILKNKLYKHMTSITKNKCIDELTDIVSTYNNTYHSTIKIKLAAVKSSTYNQIK